MVGDTKATVRHYQINKFEEPSTKHSKTLHLPHFSITVQIPVSSTVLQILQQNFVNIFCLHEAN